MRRPQDTLSQRILVYDLRHAIDCCMRKPWDTVAQRRLDRLVEENLRNTFSTHVLYNIGIARREWLMRYAEGARAAWIAHAALMPQATAESIRRALVRSGIYDYKGGDL